ncbi:MAG: glucose-1-phosphate adenylyltransferase [Nitrospinae bacterium]|nr:glucose-1-phosphate adenylyltransferase [Nitrospinota bacterium]
MDVMAMIMAGGQGERLMPLTKDRAKPAVPFGGRFRIIDFVLSNFLNSKISRIKLLTQFKSDSLNRHLARGWQLAPRFGMYIDPVPAQMRTGTNWYLGTADAIYQNLNLIQDEHPQYVAVFGGDHIYRMDIRQMAAFHIAKKAEMTISVIPKPIAQASGFGILEVDSDWRVIGFEEKPKNPKPMPGRPDMALVSMGNYFFNRLALVDWLTEDAKQNTAHDFGKDIITSRIKTNLVYAYDFSSNIVPGMEEKERGYWRDVGTLDEYYAASMDLVEVVPTFNLYNNEWRIWTFNPTQPPAKFVFADNERMGVATDSLVSEGCVISGGRIHRCVLSPSVRINSYCNVEDSILMEGVNVGRHSRIRKAIIDKYVSIPPGTEIGFDPKHDRERFHVTDSGIVVISKKTVIAE